jgi:H+/Cl- antiporter ClcA
LAITFVAFMGAISAAFSGFSGGRLVQHHLDFGGGSDWSYLNDQLGVAVWLCLLAFICGAAFLVLVWWKGHRNDDRFA